MSRETTNCDEIDELMTRYAYGAMLSEEDIHRVENHLETCPSCSELVFFIQKTMAIARNKPIRFEPPIEPCPSTDTLIALDGGLLDEDTAKKAKLHLLACRSCREMFLKLRTFNEQRVEDRVPEYLNTPNVTDAGIRLGLRDYPATAVLEGNLRISGTGRILQFGPTLRKSLNSESGIVIGHNVTDETGSESLIGVVITPSGDDTAKIFIGCTPSRKEWSADLDAAGGDRLFSTPIDDSLMRLAPVVPLGLYVISVRKLEKQLASFFIELRRDPIPTSTSRSRSLTRPAGIS